MIKTHFGIIDEIDYSKDYGKDFSSYEQYGCVFIDDDIYINDWWEKLLLVKTYFHNVNATNFALARWGVTLIPPESLPIFQDIVITDKRIKTDENLAALAVKIQKAIDSNKFMIHLGV